MCDSRACMQRVECCDYILGIPFIGQTNLNKNNKSTLGKRCQAVNTKIEDPMNKLRNVIEEVVPCTISNVQPPICCQSF